MNKAHNSTSQEKRSKPQRKRLLWICCLVSVSTVSFYSIRRYNQKISWEGDKRFDYLREIHSKKTDHQQISSDSDNSESQESTIRFSTVEETGIDFIYDNGSQGDFHLAETLGGGIGASDLDKDGQTDFIFVNGGDPIRQKNLSGNSVSIYRQIDEFKFNEISAESMTVWDGYGHGVCVGDLNNDGFDDLILTGYQSAALFINMGDGTFEEMATDAGLSVDRWCATAAMSDLDLDGDLDIYIAAYADTPPTRPTPTCMSEGQRIHCHPHYYSAVPDYLFENLGNGQFLDRSEESGITQDKEYGLGVSIVDFDNDGQPEIFLANDGDRNLLYTAQGNWKYSEIGLSSGIAYRESGQSTGSMGIASADFDNDGDIDLLTTNFIQEPNALFENLGENIFVTETTSQPIHSQSLPMVGWSAVPVDANLDGTTELFVSNGHVTDAPSSEFMQRPHFFLQDGSGNWKLADNLGSYFEDRWHGRGAIAVDLTNDGLEELIISHIDQPVTILKNHSKAKGLPIKILVVGRDTNRSAANIKISMTSEDRSTMQERTLCKGYLCSSTTPCMLSVSKDSRPSITITWTDGNKQTFNRLQPGQSYIVVEGQDELLKVDSMKN